jgi:hypothetical protein
MRKTCEAVQQFVVHAPNPERTEFQTEHTGRGMPSVAIYQLVCPRGLPTDIPQRSDNGELRPSAMGSFRYAHRKYGRERLLAGLSGFPSWSTDLLWDVSFYDSGGSFSYSYLQRDI